MGNMIRRSLAIQIIIAALFAWLITGIFSEQRELLFTVNEPLSLIKTLYIGLLKSIVGLMVLFSLIEGISNIGSIVKLKK